jgi:hypothetical protein
MGSRNLNLCITAAIGACLFVNGTEATSQTFVAARLIELQRQDKLECPTDDQSSGVFVCQVVIDEKGKGENDRSTHCFGDRLEDRSFARELRRRIRKSEFLPASNGNGPVRVYASFQLSFQGNGEACEVDILPNLGIPQGELGLSYLAPQEIYTEEGWIGRLSESERVWQIADISGLAFVMSVEVDELGIPSDGRIEMNSFAPAETAAASVRALEDSEFIPAIVDGKPVRARYYEFMYIR